MHDDRQLSQDNMTPADFARDPALEAVIKMFAGARDDKTAKVAVTLTIGGVIVRGDLCSFRLWAETLLDIPGSMGGVNFPFLQSLIETFRESEREHLSSGAPRSQIHLKNVTLINGPTIVQVACWRGRLSEVSGWSFGE